MVKVRGSLPWSRATNVCGVNLGNFHQKFFFRPKFRSFCTISIFDKNSYFIIKKNFLLNFFLILRHRLPQKIKKNGENFSPKKKLRLAENVLFYSSHF